jgi:hypothetical protein
MTVSYRVAARLLLLRHGAEHIADEVSVNQPDRLKGISALAALPYLGHPFPRFLRSSEIVPATGGLRIDSLYLHVSAINHFKRHQWKRR